ncbi:MAG: DnaJ domain-containing protein [Fluviicola sp.]
MNSRYYRILGLPNNASISDVRKQYRRLVMQYHPDKNPSPDAQRKFIEIKEAYEILTGKKAAPVHQIRRRDNSRNTANSQQQKQKEQQQRAKEAQKRYEEQKLREYLENELYFRKLTQGWRWKLMKASAILGIVLALAMTADLVLPHHYENDVVTGFNSNAAFGIGGKRVSLIGTEESGKFWIEHFNSQLYYGNHEILIESSWLFHNPMRIQKQSKSATFGYPVNFNFYRLSFILIPLFLLPAFTLYYKRRKISFTVLYQFCMYGVNGVMICMLISGDRWAHLLTFGFL